MNIGYHYQILVIQECYLELLTPEIMKLLRSIKSKKTKDEDGENVPY